MKNLIFQLVFLLMHLGCYSQFEYVLNDYIITLSGDTIYGKVYEKNASFKVEFVNNSAKKVYKANEILGYKKGIVECKAKTNEIPNFYRIRQTGEITLYSSLGNLHSGDVYCIEDSNGFRSIALNDLKESLSDYPDLVAAIKNGCYEYDDIPFIIKTYNKWKKDGENYINPLASLEEFKDYSEGTLYLKNGKDLNGFLKYDYVKERILIKDFDRNEYKYSKKDIESFILNNQKYINISNKGIFKEVIEGNISVLKRARLGEAGKVYYYYLMHVQDSTPTMYYSWDTFKNFISDNDLIMEKVNEKYYGRKNDETMLFIYNME